MELWMICVDASLRGTPTSTDLSCSSPVPESQTFHVDPTCSSLAAHSYKNWLRALQECFVIIIIIIL